MSGFGIVDLPRRRNDGYNSRMKFNTHNIKGPVWFLVLVTRLNRHGAEVERRVRIQKRKRKKRKEKKSQLCWLSISLESRRARGHPSPM